MFLLYYTNWLMREMPHCSSFPLNLDIVATVFSSPPSCGVPLSPSIPSDTSSSSTPYEYTQPSKTKQKNSLTPQNARSHPFFIPLNSNPQGRSPLNIHRPLLDPKPRVRRPERFHLRVRQFLVHLLHVYQLFNSEDLTGDVGRDRVVDGAHALVQAERFEHAAGFARQADGGAHEGHAEEGRCCWGGHRGVVVGVGVLGWPLGWCWELLAMWF
jgi:hypothetical protein